uniref:Uncharacterized protein n=1 Tax=Romanomermis culicivorax TaxID=13658 RepID=A0A915JI76_ROMCU
MRGVVIKIVCTMLLLLYISTKMLMRYALVTLRLTGYERQCADRLLPAVISTHQFKSAGYNTNETQGMPL